MAVVVGSTAEASMEGLRRIPPLIGRKSGADAVTVTVSVGLLTLLNDGAVPIDLKKVAVDKARKRGLARLMLRWPERRADLRQRFANDPGFAELCDAYETACDAALFWSKSSAPFGPERAEEYRTLMSATEQDILHRLS